MGATNKRIAIARAIMYKELAKRNAERERECRRRGLWVLWLHQTQYKTLWHFLRASNKRLIEICDITIDDLNQRLENLIKQRNDLCQAFQRRPNRSTSDHIDLLLSRIDYYNRSKLQLSELINKLTGGNNNEN